METRRWYYNYNTTTRGIRKMAERYNELSEAHQEFIAVQKIFFVATAAREGSVNVSPKGYDSLRVLNKNELVWLNLTGSGNETAAHLLDYNRMTLMFCAFEGLPRILRLYGTAETIHPGDDQWQEWVNLFDNPAGARQLFHMRIQLVQTSCGYAVPFMDFLSERHTLRQWTEKRGEDEIKSYWSASNSISLDGKETDFQPNPEQVNPG
jgi:hypothetical protein